MEREFLEDDALLQKLRDSRRRFQSRMQQLLEKYNQPFEDAPVVEMSTLTYETPQGSRVWGGRLVVKNYGDQIQGSPAKTAGDGELPAPCARDLRADPPSSDVGETFHQDDGAAATLPPTVPWSPLKDGLRRKYLNQVDILLQEAEHSNYGDRNNTPLPLVPSLVSPPRPAHGRGGWACEAPSLGPPASAHPRSTDVAVVPRSDGVSWQEASSDSFSSSQSFMAADISNATLSDLYAGMLHSMSRLLRAKPACTISTRTFVVRGWASRRRHGGGGRSRLNRTYCRGARHPGRGSQEGPGPRLKPGREAGVLRECQNSRDLSGQTAGFQLEKRSFEVNKLQIWKELKGTPQKLSALTPVDSSAAHRLDRERRLMTLQWLISPVKIVSGPRVPQGEGGNRRRELQSKFEKLHQEYCLSPRRPPCLACPPSPSGLRVPTAGGWPPGGPRRSETHHRPSRPSGRAKARSLNEAFENLGERAVEPGRWPAESGSWSSLPGTHAPQSPGWGEPAADLFPGSRPGLLRKPASLGHAAAGPGVQPRGSAKDRYSEIKEKFDQLHQQCCPQSAPRAKAPLCPGASPGRAGVHVPNQKDFLGKLNPDSGCQGPPTLPVSPQGSIRSSQAWRAAEAPRSPWFSLAVECDPLPQTKRLRLSDPQACRRWAGCQDPPRMVGRAIPRPGEEARRRKREEECTFQNGR